MPNSVFHARPKGLEPPTPGSEDRCSIQLSYGRVPKASARSLGYVSSFGFRNSRLWCCNPRDFFCLGFGGRSDGIRTRDPQDHNLVR